MKRFIFFLLLTIFFFCKGSSQTPTVYKRYTLPGKFPSGVQTLTLSSDGIFYYSVSVESRAFVAKGNWKIKGDRMFLTTWSRQNSYPRLKIDFVKQSDTGKVLLSAKDAFQQPFRNLGVALIRKGSNGDFPNYTYLDSTGKLTIDKNEYSTFYLLYQYGDSEAKEFDSTVQYYSFGPEVHQIKLYVDFDGSAPLNRGVVLFDYGSHE
ncbi:MAG: hypothetical protein ACXVBX_10500, partial [Flavisolibacter sp.]